MSKYMGPERRRFVRIPFWFVTKYREYPYPVCSAEEFRQGMGKNLSIGGICFECRDQFQSGQIIEVEIDTPALPQGVRVIGEIVWTKKEGPRYMYGLEFKEVKEEYIDAIREVVETFS